MPWSVRRSCCCWFSDVLSSAPRVVRIELTMAAPASLSAAIGSDVSVPAADTPATGCLGVVGVIAVVAYDSHWLGR